MPATAAPTGHSRLHLALYRLAFALVPIVTALRLGLRARRGVPPAIVRSKVQALLVRPTHPGLYGPTVLMPISGSVAWFGGVGAAAQGHDLLKALLPALIVLHLLGALHHRFILRDGTMLRMRRAQG